MDSNLNDIQTDEDIKVLVDSFYEKVNHDNLLSPVFNDIAKVNWKDHMPLMYKFWSTLLIEKKAYPGQPYPKHEVLPITQEHFNRWLLHFNTTVDDHFKGALANEAKRLASQIALAFSHKMGIAK